MKKVALILAGGKGERFWPKSRLSFPKQFLCLDNSGVTMLQKTVNRLNSLIDIDDVFIITNKLYGEICKDQLPNLPKENIIEEPAFRNTAPCIEYSLQFIKAKYQDALILVLPSDHSIGNENEYISDLKLGFDFIDKNDAIICFGIKPTNPNTNYGYIQVKDTNLKTNKAISFKEKPDEETASKYLACGSYLWNSGMYMFKASLIDNMFEKLMPKQHLFFKNHNVNEPDYKAQFETLESISIDYGISEKADNVYAISSAYDWDDIGSFLALDKINTQDCNNNTIIGDNVYVKNCNNLIVDNSSNKVVVTLGFDDAVIVNTDDAILIAKKDNLSSLKEVLSKMKEDKKDKYL